VSVRCVARTPRSPPAPNRLATCPATPRPRSRSIWRRRRQRRRRSCTDWSTLSNPWTRRPRTSPVATPFLEPRNWGGREGNGAHDLGGHTSLELDQEQKSPQHYTVSWVMKWRCNRMWVSSRPSKPDLPVSPDDGYTLELLQIDPPFSEEKLRQVLWGFNGSLKKRALRSLRLRLQTTGQSAGQRQWPLRRVCVQLQ
jgi:hypothetical protein